jgi:hypothetical protein
MAQETDEADRPVQQQNAAANLLANAAEQAEDRRTPTTF